MSALPYSSATSGDKAHSHNFIDMTGQRFGRWTVRSHAGGRKWLCVCECGAEVEVAGSALRSGRSTQCKRCGATGQVRKHGSASIKNGKFPRKYRAWLSILCRTRDKTSDRARWYGDVEVHPEWEKDFLAFDRDVPDPSDENMTIERIDNSNGYIPGNVRWATMKEQARNRRSNKMVTINGKTQCLAAWADEIGIKPGTLAFRLKNGLDPLAKGDLRKQRGQRMIEHARTNNLLPNKEQ